MKFFPIFLLFSLLTRIQAQEFEASYSAGSYISIDEDYLDVGIFVPIPLTGCYTSFLDTHAIHFNHGKWAASTGIGIRRDFIQRGILGLNAFYDYRRGEAHHDFHQLGWGFEWLHPCVDFRINAYIPVGRKTQITEFCLFDQLGDGFFATSKEIEFAYRGFDAEIGRSFWTWCDFDLYGAAGPYYYERSHQAHFWGGYGRLELTWRSNFSVQVQASYDHIHSTNVRGLFQISIPLESFFSQSRNHGCGCLVNVEPWRNRIILTDHCCSWTWNWNDRI